MPSPSTTSGTRFTRCCSTSRRSPSCDTTEEERLTQVWFAGVHSNVGGGYPDDSLAQVSLRWMADEAGQKGWGSTRMRRANGRRGPIPTGRSSTREPGPGVTTATTPQEQDAHQQPLRRMFASLGRRSTRVCSAALRSAATTTHPSSCPNLRCREGRTATLDRQPVRASLAVTVALRRSGTGVEPGVVAPHRLLRHGGSHGAAAREAIHH